MLNHAFLHICELIEHLLPPLETKTGKRIMFILLQSEIKKIRLLVWSFLKGIFIKNSNSERQIIFNIEIFSWSDLKSELEVKKAQLREAHKELSQLR